MTSDSSDKAQKRQQRLAASLKANLQKRKMQTRARNQTVETPERESRGSTETPASKPPQLGD